MLPLTFKKDTPRPIIPLGMQVVGAKPAGGEQKSIENPGAASNPRKGIQGLMRLADATEGLARLAEIESSLSGAEAAMEKILQAKKVSSGQTALLRDYALTMKRGRTELAEALGKELLQRARMDGLSERVARMEAAVGRLSVDAIADAVAARLGGEGSTPGAGRGLGGPLGENVTPNAPVPAPRGEPERDRGREVTRREKVKEACKEGKPAVKQVGPAEKAAAISGPEGRAEEGKKKSPDEGKKKSPTTRAGKESSPAGSGEKGGKGNPAHPSTAPKADKEGGEGKLVNKQAGLSEQSVVSTYAGAARASSPQGG